jgi:hypothetical protein
MFNMNEVAKVVISGPGLHRRENSGIKGAWHPPSDHITKATSFSAQIHRTIAVIFTFRKCSEFNELQANFRSQNISTQVTRPQKPQFYLLRDPRELIKSQIVSVSEVLSGNQVIWN